MATNANKGRLTIHVTIGYLVIYAVVIASIAAALAYFYARSNDDMRKVITYGSSLFGAMVALLTLIYTSQTIRQANDERKNAAAAKFIERWNTPSLTPIKLQWWTLNHELDQLTPEGRSTMLAADPPKRMTATEVLNFFEEMAVAVNTTSADEELLKRFFRTIVLAHWARYSYWITEHRKQTETAECLWNCKSLQRLGNSAALN
jgi:hypothetical protein